MIKDFVRDNIAWLKCLECGEETTIIKYKITEYRGHPDPMINHELTKSSLEGFYTKHRLCKKSLVKQFDLELQSKPK